MTRAAVRGALAHVSEPLGCTVQPLADVNWKPGGLTALAVLWTGIGGENVAELVFCSREGLTCPGARASAGAVAFSTTMGSVLAPPADC